MNCITVPLPHGGGRGQTDRLIVHAMAEFVKGDDGRVRFCTDHLWELGLSAHAIVLPDGRLLDCVPLNLIAHHARAGGNNRRSIGIEIALEGVHDLTSLYNRIASRRWVGREQWNTAAMWAVEAMRQFGDLEILGHRDVDENKRDPGEGFDLQAFATDVAERMAAIGEES